MNVFFFKVCKGEEGFVTCFVMVGKASAPETMREAFWWLVPRLLYIGAKTRSPYWVICIGW